MLFRLSSNRFNEDFYIKSITAGGKDLLISPLEIKENSEINDIKIVLATNVGSVKGRIETADETVLSQSRVILIPADRPNARALMRFCDVSETGEFFGKAAPGEYFMVVPTITELRAIRKLKLPEWTEKLTKNAEKITIKPNETTTVTIKK